MKFGYTGLVFFVEMFETHAMRVLGQIDGSKVKQ